MKILFLYSDTGGGHRAAAMAIRAALETVAPEVEVELRDGLVEGGVWPLKRAPRIYAWMMRRARWMWGLLFYLNNGPFRSRLMADLGYPATAHRLKALVRAVPADLVVSTHPLLTRSLSKALNARDPRPPFAIVVTDLVTGHWSWYERSADRLFVPTDAARDHVLTDRSYDPERVIVTGQPVHPRCAEAAGRRDALRQRFGWSETVILLVGGGEGMGGLAERARAIDDAGLGARLIVVCGRNEDLRAELDAQSWTMPVEIHGFVENLPELMAAADILVTKGGPGSIMEGCVASLPLLIYDYLPGQELGNIRLVEEANAGHYVPRIPDLVAALQRWIEDPATREQAARCSRALAVPDSAERLARALLELAGAKR